MKNVIVGYDDEIVLATSVDSALAQLFDYNNKQNNKGEGNTENGTLVGKDAKQLQDIYNSALEAQKSGDWAKYGDYIKKLGDEIDKLIK